MHLLVLGALQVDRRDRQIGITHVEKAELETGLVARSETQDRRYREIEPARVGAQLRGGQIAPGELNPVHRDHFHSEHRLIAQSRPSRETAKTQPVGPGRQLPIRPVEKAAGSFSAADFYYPVGTAHPNGGFFEAPEHTPHTRRCFFQIGCVDQGVGDSGQHPNVSSVCLLITQAKGARG